MDKVCPLCGHIPTLYDKALRKILRFCQWIAGQPPMHPDLLSKEYVEENPCQADLHCHKSLKINHKEKNLA